MHSYIISHMRIKNIIIIPALLAAACSGNGNRLSFENVSYSDSTRFVNFNAEFQLPVASDKASRAIRNQLIQTASDQLNGMFVFEDYAQTVPTSSTDELLEQCAAAKDSINTMSVDDYNMRREMIPDDLSYIPVWDEYLHISLVTDTTDYCVFLSQNYYYMGGAHGGISGAGYMTFIKKDGSRFYDFLTDDCTEGMQTLLRNGIADYLSECGEQVTPDEIEEYLLLNDEEGLIPLPQYEPYPGPEGLTFVYQQYEIAPYAIGMPAFTIAYSDIEPFMTESAKAIFLK